MLHIAKFSPLMLRLSSLNTSKYTEITEICKNRGDSRHDSKIRGGCANSWKLRLL